MSGSRIRLNGVDLYYRNGGGWTLAVAESCTGGLVAKNLTDEKVLTFGGDTPLAGSTFGAKSNYAFYSRGRTISLQGTVRF